MTAKQAVTTAYPQAVCRRVTSAMGVVSYQVTLGDGAMYVARASVPANAWWIAKARLAEGGLSILELPKPEAPKPRMLDFEVDKPFTITAWIHMILGLALAAFGADALGRVAFLWSRYPTALDQALAPVLVVAILGAGLWALAQGWAQRHTLTV